MERIEWADGTVTYEGDPDFTNDTNGQYKSLLENQKKLLKAQQERQAKQIQAQVDEQIRQINARRPELDQNFKDNAQQAYIQNMQSRKELPQTLAAQGYNGGLTESSNVALETNYGNAYNNYKRDYDKNIRSLEDQISAAKAAGKELEYQSMNDYDKQISDLNWNVNQALLQAQQDERAAEIQAQAEAARMEREFEQQKELLALKNQYAQSSSGSSGTSKPALTASQAASAYEKGIRSSGVLNALRYYYGDDFLEDENAAVTPAAAQGTVNYPSANEVGNQLKNIMGTTGQSAVNRGGSFSLLNAPSLGQVVSDIKQQENVGSLLGSYDLGGNLNNLQNAALANRISNAPKGIADTLVSGTAGRKAMQESLLKELTDNRDLYLKFPYLAQDRVQRSIYSGNISKEDAENVLSIFYGKGL